jgi:peptidoglycan hydrolase-like protein with peptidoglycan-binding domain
MYQRKPQGPELAKIETGVRHLGLYAAPIDGNFGDGTESGVKAFQKGSGLAADGQGPKRWGALFGGAVVEVPAIVNALLGKRRLKASVTIREGTLHVHVAHR